MFLVLRMNAINLIHLVEFRSQGGDRFYRKGATVSAHTPCVLAFDQYLIGLYCASTILLRGWDCSGHHLANEDVLRIARMFKDELTLANIARPQLVRLYYGAG